MKFMSKKGVLTVCPFLNQPIHHIICQSKNIQAKTETKFIKEKSPKTLQKSIFIRSHGSCG